MAKLTKQQVENCEWGLQQYAQLPSWECGKEGLMYVLNLMAQEWLTKKKEEENGTIS